MLETGPPLTASRVSAVERRLGVSLPSDYRAFLLKHNGGRPTPEFFPIRGFTSSFDGVHFFKGIDREYQSSNIDWSFRILKGRIPRNLFPIASTGCGDVICLSLQGQDKGMVYFWDHEREHRPPTYDNLYLIAPSFPEFLEAIHFRDLSAEIAKALVGAKVIKRPN